MRDSSVALCTRIKVAQRWAELYWLKNLEDTITTSQDVSYLL